MKRILILLEDEEHEQLLKKKGNMTWEQYFKRDII